MVIQMMCEDMINIFYAFIFFLFCSLAPLLVSDYYIVYLYDSMQSAEPHVMQEKQREIKQLFKK